MENTKKNIEIITEYKSGRFVTGGKVFISVDVARSILKDTEILPIPATDESGKYNIETTHEMNLLMLGSCREILILLAETVLGAAEPTMDLHGVFNELNSLKEDKKEQTSKSKE